MSQQTTNRSFDDLARALAEGSLSRRGALKLFAGTAIAALIPSRVLADEDCVRVCHVPFDPDTEECDFANAVTRCVSRRERRRHLENHPCDCRGRCANCLCLPDGDPCTEATAQQCCSGSCSNDVCCPGDRVGLPNGTCVLERDPNACFCPENCFCTFEADPDQAEPRVFCFSSKTETPCPEGHSDCPEGQFCGNDASPLCAECAVCFVAC